GENRDECLHELRSVRVAWSSREISLTGSTASVANPVMRCQPSARRPFRPAATGVTGAGDSRDVRIPRPAAGAVHQSRQLAGVQVDHMSIPRTYSRDMSK